jgi:FtsH-binding integral membrane protein
MPYDHEMDIRLPAESVTNERVTFIRRTYAHLAGAILAFVLLETILVQVASPEFVLSLCGQTALGQLVVLVAFLAAGWMARAWAYSNASLALQYVGLGLYVVVQALLCLPLLYIAAYYIQDKTLIPTAGILTFSVFAGLTLTVFVTKKDYSFLRPILCVGSMILLGVAVAAIFIQAITLGLLFAFALVALVAGYILYDTSNVLHHYHPSQYVAAALELFADVATMFRMILYILMEMNRRN